MSLAPTATGGHALPGVRLDDRFARQLPELALDWTALAAAVLYFVSGAFIR